VKWVRVADRAMAVVVSAAIVPATVRAVTDGDGYGSWALVAAMVAIAGSVWVEDRRGASS